MAEEIINASQYSPPEESNIAPIVPRSTRKKGGWTAIAFILGKDKKHPIHQHRSILYVRKQKKINTM